MPALGAGPRTRLISKTTAGAFANEDSYHASISASGRFVGFDSEAQNLPGRDLFRDVYIRGPLR